MRKDLQAEASKYVSKERRPVYHLGLLSVPLALRVPRVRILNAGVGWVAVKELKLIHHDGCIYIYTFIYL